MKQIGIIGSGSWATALAKILTDNQHHIHWWFRNAETISHLKLRHHNKHHLSSVYFDSQKIMPTADLVEMVEACDVLILAVPSAFLQGVLEVLPTDAFAQKRVISAVKGLITDQYLLINDYACTRLGMQAENYYTITGPCHAEEVANEKLSYLTFSGADETSTEKIAQLFETEYLKTVVNLDVTGVQLAAVMKNIYALGAGIAHGLEYGDNFMSVYIANGYREMKEMLRAYSENRGVYKEGINYSESAYLGDLLVTCYSLHSRNRTFGNMIGKGYTVKATQLELNMVAEGYYASRSLQAINAQLGVSIPIATSIFQVLWEGLPAVTAFEAIEKVLC
jgi:glycerol-3-phosphate dehydrogenase (NAD(P)+)